MIKRTITNAGIPLQSEDGTPIGGLAIHFQLVNSVTGLPEDALDIVSGDHVFPLPVTITTATTNTTGVQIGEFTVDLWPTDRADHPVQYRVSMPGAGSGARQYTRPLPSGDTALTWYQFLTGNSLGNIENTLDGNFILDETELG